MRALMILVMAFAPATLRAEGVTVFAAASLGEVLGVMVQEFEAQTGHEVTLSVAGSSTLARQIAQGAPADIFISASADWMDYLAARDLIASETRFDLAGNRLVLVGHGPDGQPADLRDLPRLLGADFLAMALVDSVPAGVYGKAALMHLGLWDAVSAQVAQSDNVRAALALVATGAAPFGIVYASDARATDDVHILAEFPADSHDPILYPAAALRGASQGAALRGYLDYLASDRAAEVLRAHGFIAPAEPRP